MMKQAAQGESRLDTRSRFLDPSTPFFVDGGGDLRSTRSSRFDDSSARPWPIPDVYRADGGLQKRPPSEMSRCCGMSSVDMYEDPSMCGSKRHRWFDETRSVNDRYELVNKLPRHDVQFCSSFFQQHMRRHEPERQKTRSMRDSSTLHIKNGKAWGLYLCSASRYQLFYEPLFKSVMSHLDSGDVSNASAQGATHKHPDKW